MIHERVRNRVMQYRGNHGPGNDHAFGRMLPDKGVYAVLHVAIGVTCDRECLECVNAVQGLPGDFCGASLRREAAERGAAGEQQRSSNRCKPRCHLGTLAPGGAAQLYVALARE